MTKSLNQLHPPGRHSSWWAIRWLVAAAGLAIFILVYCPLAFSAESTPTKEYQIKAAYLYNFTKFVEWPSNSFNAADSPLVIGIFGPESFVKEVESAVASRTLNGRPFAVKHIQKINEIKGVHLLFTRSADERELAAIFEATKGESVVTVGESDSFAKLGGMIRFVMDGDKVRFEINAEKATQAGLKLSAQLLKLAKPARRS